MSLEQVNNLLDYTNRAWDIFAEVADDVDFFNADSTLIYQALQDRIPILHFGDYLRRYISKIIIPNAPDREFSLKEYQEIIRDSFEDRDTPCSFSPTTAKMSALSKNWLTQDTVKRDVVLLLGFGLGMSLEEVNEFLTKALGERALNPKDPKEVICWYCYKNHYRYPKYAALFEQFESVIPQPDCRRDKNDLENTVSIRNSMMSIHDDISLISYLAKLKAKNNRPQISVTALEVYKQLYNRARELVAQMYNQDLVRQNKKTYSKKDITAGDLESVLSSAIPKDRNGNLSSVKLSNLSKQVAEKRFSRQRVGSVLDGSIPVNRFDLITLNFLVFSQRTGEGKELTDSFVRNRFFQFINSTNDLLNLCSMGELYIQNPYECFILMCMASQDPLGTYADVWEMSYMDEKEIQL